MGGPLKTAWQRRSDSDLADARAESDAQTLSERAEAAIAWYIVTLADLASRARNETELSSMLASSEPTVSLRSLWNSRQRKLR
jgi:hypothetical protein